MYLLLLLIKCYYQLYLKKMTVKKITWMLFAFILSFTLLTLSNNANASYFSDSVGAEGTDCGVQGSGDLVASKSFSICKEDIAYNILYMSFSKIFNSFPILKSFLFEDAGSLDMSGYANDMGGAILAVILGLTQIVFIVGGIVLGLVTIKVIFKSMTSGQFLGQGVNKVWLILRTLGVIFLIFPLDSTVSLSQLFIIMVALFSIMGGNFFYGLFLSVQQEQSLVAESTYQENIDKAVGQSEAMVQMSLCQSRTIKSIRNKHFKDYEDGFITDLDFNDQMTRIANCIAPEVYFNYPSTNILGAGSKYGNVDSINFGKKTVCEGVGGSVLFSDYDTKYHGHSFSCGSISFSNPDIGTESNSSSGKEDANSWFFSTTQKEIDAYVAAGYAAYSVESKLGEFEGVAAKVKTGAQFNFDDLEGSVNSTADTFTALGKSLYEKVKSETDHNTAVKTLFVANSLLLNNLLGSKSNSAETILNKTGVLIAMTGPASATIIAAGEIAKNLDDKLAQQETDLISQLSKYSLNASSSLDETHCLKNYRKVLDATSKTIKDFKEFSQTDFEDYIKNKDFYGECLWFVPINETKPRYINSPIIKVGGQELKVTFGSSEAVDLIENYNDVENKIALEKLKATKIPELFLDAQSDKMVLASHFYVVRSAIKKSMLDVLNESTDKELPKKMRKMGFASFGGFILQMSADQTNANRYIKQINNAVNWTSYSEEGGSGYYIDTDAYGNAEESLITNEVEKFSPMTLSGYFSAGSNTNTVVAGAANGGESVTSDEGSSFVTAIFRGIENGLTAPLVYLKKMGGTDLNLPLREGVAKCFKESNCYPGEIHPVNALGYMGVDLIDTSVNFFLVHAVLTVLNSAMSSEDSNGKVKGGWKGKVATIASSFPLTRVVKVGVAIGVAITKALYPIFTALFLMGIFFGYMLPIMPYAAFFIMFLGWLVFIFQLLFTVPIWLIMIAIPAPNGQPRGNVGLLWQYTLLLLLKPSLMVIGLIIAWFFSIVSVFFINMTLFGALGPVFEASEGEYIMKFIDVIMFYFIYLVVIFVALKHSFSIISSFPDSAAQALELRGYDDSKTISNVGAEQLLGLMIVNRVKDSITTAFSTAMEEIKNDPDAYKEEALREARKAAGSRADARIDQMNDEDGKQNESSLLSEAGDLLNPSNAGKGGKGGKGGEPT